MDVGSSIRSLRLAHGLTQGELAATLYVSRQTISHWESNRTTPDAQSLVMMSALFEASVDDLVKGGVETMIKVQAQQAQKARVSVAASAAIGLAGCAAVASPLVQAAGPLVGGVLALTPLATALAVAGATRAGAREQASLSVLHAALRSGVTLRLLAHGTPRELAVTVTDSQDDTPYVIEHVARVVRGERWVIRGREGRRAARVAYRLITIGIQTPSLEARIDGVGTLSLRKNMLLNTQYPGMASVWRLEGCDVSIYGDWLGTRIDLAHGEKPLAALTFSPHEEGEATELRVKHGVDADLAVTLAFLLALVRSEERRIQPRNLTA